MKHLKTYEGLFDFFKKKKEVTKRNFEITDDLYQTVSEILQDADLMGLEVSTQITGRGNIYSMLYAMLTLSLHIKFRGYNLFVLFFPTHIIKL